jgi:hypothetical protein
MHATIVAAFSSVINSFGRDHGVHLQYTLHAIDETTVCILFSWTRLPGGPHRGAFRAAVVRRRTEDQIVASARVKQT